MQSARIAYTFLHGIGGRQVQLRAFLFTRPPLFRLRDFSFVRRLDGPSRGEGRSNDAISRRQNNVLYPILVTPK